MRIGLYGGAFNPIHNGHLHLAGCAKKELGLKKVWFVPCFNYAGTKDLEGNAHHREEITGVCREYIGFYLCNLEIKRKGISYTIDTVRHIKEYMIHEEFVLILGPDNEDISTWEGSKELKELIDIKVAGKDFGMTPLPIRSSMIRERIKNDRSITGLVPLSVEKYIQENGLYK